MALAVNLSAFFIINGQLLHAAPGRHAIQSGDWRAELRESIWGTAHQHRRGGVLHFGGGIVPDRRHRLSWRCPPGGWCEPRAGQTRRDTCAATISVLVHEAVRHWYSPVDVRPDVPSAAHEDGRSRTPPYRARPRSSPCSPSAPTTTGDSIPASLRVFHVLSSSPKEVQRVTPPEKDLQDQYQHRFGPDWHVPNLFRHPLVKPRDDRPDGDS